MNSPQNINDLLQLADNAIHDIDHKINEKIRLGDRSVVKLCLDLDIQTFYIDKKRINELKKILAGVHQHDYPREIRVELVGFIGKYHPLTWRTDVCAA